MSARIVLVRHARSSHEHDGRWMRHHDVHLFERAYNDAGIRDDSHPPRDLVDLAASADVVCASDMIRAFKSAERLAPGANVAVSPLLREIELEPPRWMPIPLPIEIWDMVSHWQWTQRLWAWRLAAVTRNAFVERGTQAADWLIGHAGDARTVVAVTHGGFRRILADQLLAKGWRADAPNSSYANWSAWSYGSRG